MKIPSSGPLDPRDFDIETVPRHVAIIMDGNGRWAKGQGQPRVFGHRAGAGAVRKALRLARRMGIEYLTLYAFSEQNWARPPLEVRALMTLLVQNIRSEQAELIEQGVRFRAMGDLSKLSPEIRKEVRGLEQATAHNTALQLVVALSYGGREELVSAVRSIAADAAAGKIKPADVDLELVGSRLYLPDVPDPDLMIRTSGELRVSNFLLWQLAYAELYVTETYWPDFDDRAFIAALQSYGQRERRYGLSGEQVKRGEC